MMVAAICVLLYVPLEGETGVDEGNSIVEFPVIVIVGQIVEVTPFSVVFENTFEGTNATDEQIQKVIEYHSTSLDFRSQGFANALKIVSVKDGKMRVSFYLDNILKVFDDDVRTYMRFIPVYYMFKNNIKNMKIPKHIVEELKKHSFDHYLNLPMAKELMKNSWLAGVFRIDPESKKLVYQGARFFKNFDEMSLDEWAEEYRIPDIVRKGMVVTMTKTVVIGNESTELKKEDKDKEDGGKPAKNKFNNKKYEGSGETK
ncbi:MAG: hypothetical protein RBT38_11990 [Bacteroidales bacterium]|nr:hypothetical protein [Bacteroidales bacterium]